MRTEGLGSSVDYGYDRIGRLASQADRFVGGSGDVTVTLGNYNPAGQLGERTSTNDAYAWSGARNLNRAYEVNGLNQYTKSGAVALDYDRNGNLISETSGGDHRRRHWS